MKFLFPPVRLAVVAALLLPLTASALVMRAEGPEPIIVQIKESLRTSDDLDTRLNEMAAFHRQNHLTVEKWWAGEKFMVMISFPQNFTEQQAITVIANIKQLPVVEKVVAFSAFNLEFKPGDFAREYGPNDTLPDVARRGLDNERLSHREFVPPNQAALDRRPHAPNRLIVRWKDQFIWKAEQTGFSQRMAAFHANAGCRVIREDRHSPTKLSHILEFDDPSTLADKLKKYMDSGLVEYAQPDYLYRLADAGGPVFPPDDPAYTFSPGPQWNLNIIHGPEAWALPCPGNVPCTGDPSVIIAVADTGAPVHHPDLSANIWSGQNVNYWGSVHNCVDDDYGHGTNVASIIGAEGNNGKFMSGVAWHVSLMILKVAGGPLGWFRGSDEDSQYQAFSSDVSAAIDYAYAHNATAMNFSASPAYYDYDEGRKDHHIDMHIEAALGRAREGMGMILVNSAGNDGRNVDHLVEPLTPTNIPFNNLIVVGATTKLDNKAAISNYGSTVKLGAPGGNLYNPDNPDTFDDGFNGDDPATWNNGILGLDYHGYDSGCAGSNSGIDPPWSPPQVGPLDSVGGPALTGGYSIWVGTSQAAPHVAGAVALIKSRYPWENYFGIRDRILMGVDHVDNLKQWWPGGGRLNLFRALQPRAQMVNLSTRARVEGGDRVMIAGFVVGGATDPITGAGTGGSVRIGLRGLGPSVPVGTRRLGNPVIELYKGDDTNTLIAVNDNWQDDSVNAAQLQAYHLAPADPLEAALVVSLEPGTYTLILRDHDSQYGVGMVEVYDLDANTNEKSRLTNLSTRCIVGTGDDVAIAGMSVRGPEEASQPDDRPSVPDRRALILGRGPFLANALSGALQDPQLELHAASGALIDSNDNFVGDDELYVAGLLPADPRESGLWPTLRPGSYTAILAGTNGSTGIGLIQFYEY